MGNNENILPPGWHVDEKTGYLVRDTIHHMGRRCRNWDYCGRRGGSMCVWGTVRCASAAIPFGYDTVEIDGKTYVDGGWESKGGDNVPLEPILENHSEIKTVIVVYLDDETDLNRERLEKNRADSSAARVRLIEIIPSKNIGGAFNGWRGVFDASPDTAKRLIELGRKDAEKMPREDGISVKRKE